MISAIPIHTFAAVKTVPQTTVYRMKQYYKISHAVIDPNSPYLYFTDMANKKVHRLNYETGKTISISFKLKPERMIIHKGLLYVTLLKKEHSPYIFDEDQEGVIGVLDLKTFTLKKQLDVNTDPYDMTVDRNGNLYVSSGSGQHTSLKSYSLITNQENHWARIYDASFIEMHPSMNKIYSFSSNISPRDGYAYNISNGKFIEGGYKGGYNSPYHGEYPMTPRFALSPDGQYIFNYAGTVFGCGAADYYDMNYITKLNSPFNAIAFNVKDNYFYTAVKGKKVEIYDQLTLKNVSSLQTQGDSEYLFYKYSKLISVSKHSSGFYFIEVLKGPQLSRSKAPQNVKHYLPYNANISDTEIDPVKSVMYLADPANSKIYGINYQNFSVSEVKLNLPPERIVLKNGKLYVTLLKMPHDHYTDEDKQKGAIAIIDTDTMKLLKQFDIRLDPYDIEVDKNGNIYISSGSGQSTSMKIFSEKTGEELSSSYMRSAYFIEYNTRFNKIYAITTRSSPRDIYAYNIENGKFAADIYDSPYHGDYNMSKALKISPDDKYLFNGGGFIFNASNVKKEDITFVKKLNKGFTDVAFDVVHKRFYTVVEDKFIYSYHYDSFEGIGTYTSKGAIQSLDYKDGKLIALTKIKDRGYIIEKFNP
jgi:hypothetical protein